MREVVRRTGGRWLPVLFAGLFAGRVLSEAIRPGLGGALLISAATLFAALLLYRLLHRRLPQRSPAADQRLDWLSSLLLALPLAAYLLYPEADPLVAGALLALSLTLLMLGWQVGKRFRSAGRLLEVAPALIVAAGSLALYTVTLAPDLLSADNGEFQLVAATLGVAHPPGYALYTLLAHLMTLLPIGPTPAYRVNLFAALTSAATLLLVYAGVYRLSGSRFAGLAAVLALGTATTYWAQATTANIRSMTALFAAIAFLALIRIGAEAENRFTPDGKPDTSRVQWAYVMAALALGFGIVHHVSLVFMSAVCVLYLLSVDPPFFRSPRRWLPVLLAGLLGLLPLLYLPLRAGSGAPGTSPQLATLSGFLDHILARGFSGDFFYFTSPGELWERLRIMLNVLTLQFMPLLLAAAGLGWLLLLRRNWKTALLLGGTFALHTLMTAVYRAPQTVEYMLPAYLPIALCLGYGVGNLLSVSGPVASLGRFLVAVLLLAGVLQGLARWPSFRQLHHDFTARNYGEGLLEPAPDDALVLSDWHWVTPMWYLQQVEGNRGELEVRFVFPEGEPYGLTWADRIQAGLESGRNVIATHYDEPAYAALPPPEPLEEAFWFRQEPRMGLPADFSAADLTLGDRVQIGGYRLEDSPMRLGAESVLTLAWQPVDGSLEQLTMPVVLFAHLVGVDDQVYAQADVIAAGQSEGITLTQLRLTPRLETAPGSYRIMIGAYSALDGTPLLAPGGESRVLVTGSDVGAMFYAPFSQERAFRPLLSEPGAEMTLIGLDWDNTLPGRTLLYRHWRTAAGFVTDRVEVTGDDAPMPDWYGPWGLLRTESALPSNRGQYYVPLGDGLVYLAAPPLNDAQLGAGSTTALTARFAAARPVLHDWVVSTRLVGFEPDGRHWAWWDLHDGIPALGAIPTLKWIAGSQVRDPHPVSVSGDATPNQSLGGILLLYDAFTGRPLPILDAEIARDHLGIPLGDTKVIQ